MNDGKKIRRVCVWLMMPGHVFMVVWEKGENYDVVYFADNIRENAWRSRFLYAFVRKISGFRLHKPNNVTVMDRFSESIFSGTEVQITPDMMCVSFMARCTVYLSSMCVFLDKGQLKCILNSADIYFHKKAYAQFEERLYTRLLENLVPAEPAKFGDAGKCVWLPVSMNQRFVNINDVKLICFDAMKGAPETADTFDLFLTLGDIQPTGQLLIDYQADPDLIVEDECPGARAGRPFGQTCSLSSRYYLASSLVADCRELLSRAVCAVKPSSVQTL
jgi:hypothetical protein